MSYIKELCETCRYKAASQAYFPCVDCCSRDRWEVAETIAVPSKAIYEMESTIEALQQEIEQLQDENASIRNWNICEEKLHNELLESDKRRWELEEELEDANNYREGLEAIVDKLRAQAARMREALEQFKYDYEQGMNMSRNYNAVCELLRDAAPTDYHNPADVAEIERLKEQVDTLSDTVNMLAPAEIGKECRHIEILKQASEALTLAKDQVIVDKDAFEKCISENERLNKELQELAKAKEEGRLVVLPCKVWDMMVWDRFGRPWTVTQIELHMDGQIWFRCGHKGTEDYTAFSAEDIGEDFFLTEHEGKASAKRLNAEMDKNKVCVREAAEKALGGGEG